MNLEGLLVRKNTSKEREKHKGTSSWKVSRDSNGRRRILEFSLLPKI
jgi:hypothetical protein